MKKIISAFFVFSSIVFASTIELTGKYSQELGNPFRALLEKKNETVKIYSKDNNVELEVESNLDNNSIYNIHLQHPKKYILKNKTIENVVEDYYSEEYKVLYEKGDIELNVLSGKVFITYIEEENNQINNLINKVEVELDIEIINKGKKTLKTVKLDNNLGKKGKNYSGAIVLSDFKNITIKTLSSIVTSIIEVSIFNSLK